MNRTTIAAIFADQDKLGGKTVTVCGWARTIRDMKTFGFIELNDGSCFKNLQVVMDANMLDNYKDIAGQNVGAALIITGTVVLTPQAKQPLEVKAQTIAVEGASTPDYPLQKKRHSCGVSAHHPAPAAQDQPVLRRLPGALRGRSRHPLLLPGPGLRLCPHPHHHRQRLRRARARCSR